MQLDFTVDSECLQKMHDKWMLFGHEQWAYGVALFEAPVFLEIEDTVLLNWIPAPLYFIASSGLAILRQLPKERRASLNLPGTSFGLVFEIIANDTVRVQEVLEEKSASGQLQELSAAWRQFSLKFRDFVASEFSRVFERTDGVGEWFRGLERP